MPTNDFFPYATDPSANVISQATWAAGNLSQGQTRAVGFLGGLIAESEEANKVWRQSQFVASMVAAFISDTLGVDVLDDGNLNGLIVKFSDAIRNVSGRIKVLTPFFDLYVAVGGNDANPGTSGAPFATIQRAWNYLISSVDLNGNRARINVGAGTYGPVFAFGIIPGQTDATSVIISGDIITPINVVVAAFDNNCFTGRNANFTVEGFSIEASGGVPDVGIGLSAEYSSTILYKTMNFGSCSSFHQRADLNAAIIPGASIGDIGTSYTIAGNAFAHLAPAAGGQILNVNCEVGIVGNPNFPSGFAFAAQGGNIISHGTTWSGTATGLRYYVDYGSGIYTEGSGANYFPGDLPGQAFGPYT